MNPSDFHLPSAASAPQQAPAGRRGRLAWLLAAPLILAAVLILVTSGARAQKPSPSQSCIRHDAAVTLSEDPAAARYRIAGWLCQPRIRNSTVQVVVAGLTYSHLYWTGPGPRNDYVRAALAAGSAVYSIDRLGTGNSDRPAGDQVTAATEAKVLHQLVQALRHGELGRYSRVIGVGHSFGSFVWMVEAAGHHDVDALVLTGLLHQNAVTTLTAFIGTLHPASADPAFATTTMPVGYLTTEPGHRAEFFLNPPDTTPGAATWDEHTKATATTGELSFTPADELAASQQIHVPVLLLVGANDVLFCSTGLPCATGNDRCHRERLDYPGDTPLFAAAILSAGHSINLHQSAPDEFRIANRWIAHINARPAHDPGITGCTA